MRKAKDITGNVYGSLTALSYAGKNKHNNILWKMKCECGKEIVVPKSDLTRKRAPTVSCGCRKKGKTNPNYKHGGATNGYSREYNIWCGMKYRCNSPKCKDYVNYGAKGIKVCPEWNDYAQFIKDMGPCPPHLKSIERLDLNDDYKPSNCIWADDWIQAKNKSDNVVITIDGETLILADWLRRASKSNTTYYKFLKQGLSPEEAMRKTL